MRRADLLSGGSNIEEVFTLYHIASARHIGLGFCSHIKTVVAARFP